VPKKEEATVSCITFARPKSISFTSAVGPLDVRSRFSGLRSRWIMCCGGVEVCVWYIYCGIVV
jgi:hypothetical protein